MNYKFKEQIDQRGYYSEITFNTKFYENEPIDLIINFNCISDWEIPCKAGILFFFDCFAKKRRGRLEIIIEDIKWQHVDTTNLIVTYTIMAALCENLNFELPNFSFEKDKKVFLLPLR